MICQGVFLSERGYARADVLTGDIGLCICGFCALTGGQVIDLRITEGRLADVLLRLSCSLVFSDCLPPAVAQPTARRALCPSALSV